MSRNDSLLYSGATSAAFTSVRTRRTEASEKKQEKQNKLTPAAEVVAEIIAQERNRVTSDIANLPVGIDTTEEAVKSVLKAYQLNLRFIEAFEIKMSNALRKANK